MLLMLGVCVLGAGCNESWMGFYYPDAGDLKVSIISQKFASLEECRNWVAGRRNLRTRTVDEDGEPIQDDYECGKNCKFDKDMDVYVCKETTD